MILVFILLELASAAKTTVMFFSGLSPVWGERVGEKKITPRTDHDLDRVGNLQHSPYLLLQDIVLDLDL